LITGASRSGTDKSAAVRRRTNRRNWRDTLITPSPVEEDALMGEGMHCCDVLTISNAPD
jgi:hypothetical protein